MLQQDSLYYLILRMSNGKDSKPIEVAKNVIFCNKKKQMLPLTHVPLSLCCNEGSDFLHVVGGKQFLPKIVSKGPQIVYRENDSKYSGLTTLAHILYSRKFFGEAETIYGLSKKVTDEYLTQDPFMNHAEKNKIDHLFYNESCKEKVHNWDFVMFNLMKYDIFQRLDHRQGKKFLLVKFIIHGNKINILG